MNDEKPVVLLAFANEQRGQKYLRQLPDELRTLSRILKGPGVERVCDVEVLPNATAAELDAAFDAHDGHVAVFHFGGHGGPDGLELETEGGESRLAHAGGLMESIARRGGAGLRLVFLNACATREQVAELHRHSNAAVVATSRSVNDRLARDFARRFYEGLAGGSTIEGAFQLARAGMWRDEAGLLRDVVSKGQAQQPGEIRDERGSPWDLFLRAGSEWVGTESLPKLAGDALYGLDLPAGLPLPTRKPYPDPLRPYTKAEARIFFGRAREIRELYDRVTSTDAAPVILYSGPTGVGKSSVLDAGLVPRLESTRLVLSLARSVERGLLGTLLHGLGARGGEGSEELGVVWRAKEAAGRPLVVILDQAEQAFTRPRAGDARSARAELDELALAMAGAFRQADSAPRGRLILAFRKEWLHEFERAQDDAGLAYGCVKLAPLDRAGMVEVIEGPTREPALRELYRLSIEDGLPESIAAQVESDAGSAMAPTLEVLLNRMWERAGGKDGRFTQRLFDELRDEGYLLGDVIDHGLAAVDRWRRELIETGFVLDLLEAHTTPAVTSDTCSLEELRTRYPAQSGILDELREVLKSSYLLVETDGLPEGPCRLAHDTLAPLVVKRYRESMAPAQRARRLLENRAPEWRDGRTGRVLDDADLGDVEKGLPWMRGLAKEEHALLEASRTASDQRRRAAEEVEQRVRSAEQRTRRIRNAAAVGLGVFSLLLAVAAWQAWQSARESRRVTAETIRGAGIADAQAGRTFEAMHRLARLESLRSGLAERSGDRLRLGLLARRLPRLRGILGSDSPIAAPRFSADGKHVMGVAWPREVWEWDGWTGQEIRKRSLADVERLTESSVDAEGRRVVGVDSTGRLSVWNAGDGSRKRSYRGDVSGFELVVMSPDGRRVITIERDGQAKLWAPEQAEPLAILSPVQREATDRPTFPSPGTHGAWFSPDSRTLVTGSTEGVLSVYESESGKPLGRLEGDSESRAQPVAVAFDAQGRLMAAGDLEGRVRLWDQVTWMPRGELVGHMGSVTGVAFAGDQFRLATASADGTARVWSVADQSVVAVLRGHRGRLSSVALDQFGGRVLTTAGDDPPRLWNASTGALLGVLHGHRGEVVAGQFGPEGIRILTASTDRTSRLWLAPRNPRVVEALGDRASILGLGFDTERDQLLAVSAEGEFVRFEVESGRRVEGRSVRYLGLKAGEIHQGRGMGVRVSSQGTRVVSDEGLEVVLEGAGGYVGATGFSPDGTRVLVSQGTSEAKIWDTATGKVAAVLEGGALVNQACFRADGTLLVTAEREGLVKLWDVRSGRSLGVLQEFTKGVASLAMSADGSRLAIGSVDGTARIWDLSRKVVVATLRGHLGPVSALAFAPDGTVVATGSEDGSVRLWDGQTGGWLGELEPYGAEVNRLQFHPNGTSLAVGTESGRVLIWFLDRMEGEAEGIQRWVEVATGTRMDGEEVIGLTNEEWQQRIEELRATPTSAPALDWLGAGGSVPDAPANAG